jgi:ribosomal protein L16 Arg81 hydroxylase
MDLAISGNSIASYKQFDDNWRAWIAENLLLGCSHDSIAATLRNNNFREDEIASEIRKAVESPYRKGGERLANRMKKKDWVLTNYSKLHAMGKNQNAIERRSKLEPDAFFEEYYLKNRPVIITDMLDDWPAVQSWDLDYLEKKLGDKTVEIQFGRKSNKNYEAEHTRHVKTIKLSEYFELINRHSPTNDFYLTARNSFALGDMLEGLWDDLGQLPYLDGKKGYAWIGPAGTITPMHYDHTNNFMIQLVGRKKIFLVPPYDVGNLYNEQYVYSPVEMSAIDYDAYPLVKNANIMELVLQPKEILFLPVGWWHEVVSLDISVTMTCINFIYYNDFRLHYRGY